MFNRLIRLANSSTLIVSYSSQLKYELACFFKHFLSVHATKNPNYMAAQCSPFLSACVELNSTADDMDVDVAEDEDGDGDGNEDEDDVDDDV